jgi:hypothetical protein
MTIDKYISWYTYSTSYIYSQGFHKDSSPLQSKTLEKTLFLAAATQRGKPSGYHLFYSCQIQSTMEISSSPGSMETGAPPSTVVAPAPSAAPPKPLFQALKPHEMSDGKVQFRKIPVPPHRFSPLKRNWMEIYTPIYEQMKVDIRMNLKV